MALNDRGQAQAGDEPLSGRFVVSTDSVPERERGAFFRDGVAKLVNLDIDPLGEHPPRYTMDLSSGGTVRISEMHVSPARFVRARRHLADSDDNFTFVLLEEGSHELIHAGRRTKIGPGGFYFISSSMPNELTSHDAMSRVQAIKMPGNALRALARHPEQAAGRAADPGSGSALTLLRGYMQAFGAARATLSAELLQSFGRHIVDLVASIIGATADGAAQAELGGIKAARLREVLSAIARHACDPEFSAEVVAAQLAVTTRYINRLLEETGYTFSEHVNEHRLRQAWRLLSDPHCTLKVASVAFDCGFNDLSYFNRAFRRRFGETPTSVRGASKAPPPELAPAAAAGELAVQITPFMGSLAGRPWGGQPTRSLLDRPVSPSRAAAGHDA
jgi:AraC-like DNA-binding protein